MDYLTIIRNLREDRDYTQEYVAKLLNVGQRTYTDYELGKTRIPFDSMIKLGDFFDGATRRFFSIFCTSSADWISYSCRSC